MKSTPIFESAGHRWHIVHDQDESRVIDANVYALQYGDSAMLMDPGGFEVFPSVLSALIDVMPMASIKTALVSHQDPDIASSLPLWNSCVPDMTWYVPSLWVGFIRHFGALEAHIEGIPEEGMRLSLDGLPLEIIPAHFLHASANVHLYDPTAKIYFSGDVGAALLEPGHSPLVGDDADGGRAFDLHIKHAEYFHRRWMPSMHAKQEWCERVSKLAIDFLCPQHGAIYSGQNVSRFINWFSELPVGDWRVKPET